MPMKKLASLLLGVSPVTLATFAFAQDKKNEEKKGQEMKNSENKKTGPLMSMRERNAEVMLKLFRAVERHDEEQQIASINPMSSFIGRPRFMGITDRGGTKPGFLCNLPRLNEKWTRGSLLLARTRWSCSGTKGGSARSESTLMARCWPSISSARENWLQRKQPKSRRYLPAETARLRSRRSP